MLKDMLIYFFHNQVFSWEKTRCYRIEIDSTQFTNINKLQSRQAKYTLQDYYSKVESVGSCRF